MDGTPNKKESEGAKRLHSDLSPVSNISSSGLSPEQKRMKEEEELNKSNLTIGDMKKLLGEVIKEYKLDKLDDTLCKMDEKIGRVDEKMSLMN